MELSEVNNNAADVAPVRATRNGTMRQWAPRDLSDEWAAGDVTVTRADGSTEVRPAYSKEQVLAIIRDKDTRDS